MKKTFLVSLSLAAFCAFSTNSMAAATINNQALNDGDLPLDRLSEQPGLTGPSLRAARFAPNGQQITILKGREDNAQQLDLWTYDIATGKSSMLVSSSDLASGDVTLSEEEKNRRERQRIYSNGIISYAWDDQGNTIMFPLGGDIFVYDVLNNSSRQITATDEFETDAKFSPDGKYISYVRNDELFVTNINNGTERQVTKGANGIIRNAVSEFVAQEELNRYTGYWWSPDNTSIAYTQIDETPVPIAERVDINANEVVTIRQRYPFAGSQNVNIKLGITNARKQKTQWIDIGNEKEIYIADVYWSQDGSTLYVARLTRDQKRLDLLAADVKTGKSRIILSETSNTWVNLGLGLIPLDDGGFLWSSEKSGFQHLYRYNAEGDDLGAITNNVSMVTSLNCINEETGSIYYTGWDETPLERHVFSSSINGSSNESPTTNRITTKAGSNSASFSGECENFILYHSNDRQPTQASVHDQTGNQLFWLNENKIADGKHPYAPYLKSHLDYTYGQLEAEDGSKLDYKMLKPANLKAGEKAPAIVMVYGGPHAQRVSKGFGNLMDQALADLGYVIFRLDNRGAANRGTAFENSLYRAMGTKEVEDQAVGARYLASLPFVDGEKIGVYGWSYGGYMTLRMLTLNPELYAGGVAGAPVTDWGLYDTAYTERYMGHPETDKAAYENSSVFANTDKLEDPLLVLHGMADDNVVFQNTVKLIDDLQKKGKTFELMTYPGEKHGFRAKTSRIHRNNMILDFFERTLKDKSE